MCGIAGIIGKGIAEDEMTFYLNQLSKGISRRGPDSQSVYQQNLDDDSRVGLAHARLSIIDLDERSNQPMHYKEFSIVFNGEIYNYKELRKLLETDGYSFLTSGDTEVLLILFSKFGEDMLSMLEGMFAFVIFDFKKGSCFGAVDRFGVKPLYYSTQNGKLVFASQLKSFSDFNWIKKDISSTSVNEFLHQGYISAPRTIYSTVFKMEPSTSFSYNFHDRKLSLKRYWCIEEFGFNNLSEKRLDRGEIISILESKLIQSFNKRLVADVPIGVFLSGGLDSSTLVGHLANVKRDIETFTVKFPFGVDESEHAKGIALSLGLRHSVLTLDDSVADYLDDFIEAFDEPFGDSSALPTLMISKAAKERVKVVLTGDGGDEIFGGYGYLKGYLRNVKLYKNLNFFFRFLPKAILHNQPKIMQLLSADKSLHSNNMIHNLSFTTNVADLKDIYPNISPINIYDKTFDSDPLKHALKNDLLNFLPGDILVKSDRASMHYGLELREPYLSPELASFMLQLPSDIIYNGSTKNLLRSINEKVIDGTKLFPRKQGFEIPLNYWLKNEMYFLLDEYLLSGHSRNSGYFKKEALIKLCDRFMKNNLDYTILWRVIVFEMWYKRWA